MEYTKKNIAAVKRMLNETSTSETLTALLEAHGIELTSELMDTLCVFAMAYKN